MSGHPSAQPESPLPAPEPLLHFADLTAALTDPANHDLELLRAAYDFAKQKHEGQTRRSGNPYIHHCLAVSQILAKLHLDSTTIAAGLVHDTVEDTGVTTDELTKRFGEEVAAIVDGVTKIGGIKFQSPEEHQAENWRKMVISIARDIRVILIKLADRLHNMRTLAFLPEEKQHRISRETLDIYAPLAHRFGIAAVRWELEDLALKYDQPEVYRELAEQIAATREEREAFLQRLIQPLRQSLHGQGIIPEITGRPKHFYSIYRKMHTRQKRYEEIYDLLAIRVIVPTQSACYETLGTIHSLWTPIPDRIKDYIAVPKSNRYRSLHTTVVGPDREWVEFQIRTPEMHAEANYGIAAHWAYKEGKITAPETMGGFPWLGDLVKEQADQNAEDFLDLLKSDLFQQEVFVFTPKGELRVLPKGASPIDFAFQIHTEVGNHCVGARVNGKIVPLRHELRNGDTVEIVTSPMGKPSQDWLQYVVTSGARSKIRRRFRLEHMEHSISLGKEMLEREAKRRHLRFERTLTREGVRDFGVDSVEKLYAAIGQGDLSALHVIRRLFPDTEDKAEPKGLRRILTFTRKRGGGVRVQGMSNVMIRFAQCCQPVPGEPIIGTVTRGRGISVHRLDCPNTFSPHVEKERRIAVDWDVTREDSFQVRLFVDGENRRGMLADVCSVITELETNIISASVGTEGHRATGRFLVEVRDLAHLRKVLKVVLKVKGVDEIRREDETPGGAGRT